MALSVAVEGLMKQGQLKKRNPAEAGFLTLSGLAKAQKQRPAVKLDLIADFPATSNIYAAGIAIAS